MKSRFWQTNGPKIPGEMLRSVYTISQSYGSTAHLLPTLLLLCLQLNRLQAQLADVRNLLMPRHVRLSSKNIQKLNTQLGELYTIWVGRYIVYPTTTTSILQGVNK